MGSKDKPNFAKLAGYWSMRYSWAVRLRNDLDIEDLRQAAYLGILRANREYKKDMGGFVTVAGFYARNEIRELLGIRAGKLPPVMESLDERLNDETEETRLDLLEDESIPESDAALLEEERRQAVRDAVNRLREDQRAVISSRFFEGLTYRETAEKMAIPEDKAVRLYNSAKMNLRRDHFLKVLAEVDKRTPFFLQVNPNRFNSTFTSAVEEIVFIRERLMNKVLQGKEE